MTEVRNAEDFNAYFRDDVKAERWKVKTFVVKQNPNELIATEIDAFYDKKMKGFCLRFHSDDPTALLNHTRASILKELLKNHELPFFIEAKK